MTTKNKIFVNITKNFVGIVKTNMSVKKGMFKCLEIWQNIYIFQM